MLRFLLVLVLAAGLAAGAIYYFEWWPNITATFSDAYGGTGPENTPNPGQPQPRVAELPVEDEGPRKPVEIGGLLYERKADLERAAAVTGNRPDPIVIPACHLISTDVRNVASQREGQLLFPGTEIDPATPDGPGIFTEVIDLGKTVVARKFRKLEPDHIVLPGQMLAVVNPAVAMNELDTKKAKILAANADLAAAKAMYKEADERRKTTEAVLPKGGATLEDWRGAVLARDKYREEELSKFEAVKVAQIEANQADILLKQHVITNPIPGRTAIKTVYRQGREAIKANDPVMQIYNIERLRAEGLVEAHFHNHLRLGMKAIIEPLVEEPDLRTFIGHRAEVTCVAVTGDEQAPLVVSGSADRTVCVWILTQNTPQRVLPHRSIVRSIACCTPKGTKQNLCLSGCDDGTLRLYDLNQPEGKELWKTQTPHKNSVTALAFSPDGDFFATGSDCRNICLWETLTGKLQYVLSADCGADELHQGPVHTLHFTPQCRLVSAARDNTIRVWDLHQKGVKQGTVIHDRGGKVTQLGVSPDGRFMLFDKDQRLQLLSLPDGLPGGVLRNPIGSAAFETLALFSPDSSLILTGGAPEGRLQLWRAPQENARGYEVRQWVTKERDPVTCAAFAPGGKFAVSGTKGNLVYLWGVPSRETVEQHPIRNLLVTQVEQALDANNRQVRVGVDVYNPVDDQNPFGRLRTGKAVTVVIER